MTDNEDSPKATPATAAAPTAERRGFLKVVGIGGLGAGVAAVTAVPAVAFVAYPVSHATTAGGEEFVVVGKESQFQEGVPVKVDVYSDKVDAWNRVDDVKIGSAWIVRLEGRLVAYSSVCPHLGCAVDFDPEAGDFKCPCHRSAFKKDGAVESGPSPRALDSLDVEVKEGKVSLLYRRFKQGIEAKEPA